MLKSNFMKQMFYMLLLSAYMTISSSLLATNNSDNKVKLPVLWDFGADRCIPCKMMAPILEKMEKELKGQLIVKFTDVWKSENIKCAKDNDIKSIPTQIFFDENGKELWRHVGFISEKDILAKCKSAGYDLIPKP